MTTDMDPPPPRNPSTTAAEEFPSTEPETKALDDELLSTSAPPENPMVPPPPKNSEPSESGGSHEHPPQEEVLKEGSIIDQSHVDEKEASMFRRVDDFVLEHPTISRFHAGEDNNGIDLSGNNELLDQNANIRMQTAEQQRHILRMLEKSLARELDLEKKIGESRETEEELKFKMHASEQEFLFMEEEGGVIWERLYEAENTAEVLMGISKETLGRLLIAQLNLNGSIQHAENLRFELQESVIKLEAKDSALKKIQDKLTTADSEAVHLREKVTSLEKKLKESDTELLNAKASADVSHAVHSKMHEMEKEIEDLKEKISRAENTAESAEAKCKLLTETNLKLNAELDIFRGSGSASEKVDSLEKQLGESNFQLQHALAAAEASKEKQSMLYSTVHDMENVIEGLKLRVSKAENRADSAEEKCIILSESNSYLSEERSFLMSRLKCLEAALQKAEETKLETANDIGIRTKLITNLVMQLALERERLHKQILSLTKENTILLQQADKNPSRASYDDGKGNNKDLFPKVGSGGEIKETINFSATSTKGDMTSNITSVGEAESKHADPTSTLESARNIDARQLNLRYGFMAAVALVISTLAAIWFQNRQGQF